VDRDRGGVSDDRALVAFEDYPAKSCYQVLLARPLEAGLEAGPVPVAGDDCGLVAGCHLGDGGLMLGGQGLQHRCLGVPAQRGQAPDVAGEQVVVHDAPVFGCVDPDDVVVVQVQQPGPVPGFALVPVGGALGRDHVLRDPQRDFPVDRPAAPGQSRAAVLDGDLVAEKPRRASAGVGDQRLVRMEFQGEGLPQEPCQLGLDLLGFGFRPDESQQHIIGVPAVKQPPVAGVHRVAVGEGAHLP
jgi:hypothetical protein